MKRLNHYLSLPILGLTFFTVACDQPVEVETPVRPVYTYTVPTPQAELERRFSGQLSASQGVELSFEVSGRVVELNAAQGRRFEKGAVLARVDETDFLTRLNDAKAVHVQATQELRRVQRLFETDNASQSQLDSAISKAKSSRASSDLAKKQFDLCTLEMPYAGVIASVEIDAQQVVSAGQAAIRIQGEGPMEFKFGVPSNVVAQVEAGREVQVLISDAGLGGFPAKVKKVAPSSEQNTTYMVTAVLMRADSRLREGMDGEAVLNLPNANGVYISVPLSCVLGSAGDQRYVWIVTPDASRGTATVSRRQIGLGALLAGGHVAVLDGLSAGEQVLSRGVHRVEEGMLVRIQGQ
jgi:RND family efflux transporter MFP subunit